jgi:DnaJ-class molecular chaperone
MEPCKECSGKGVVTKTVEKVISYVPGRLSLTIPNAGNSGLFGGTNGDLKVTFAVQPVNGINYDPASKAIPVTVEVFPEDIVLGVTKVVSVGAWSSYVTLEPSDFDKLPARKRVGNSDFLVSANVTRDKDDVRRAQEWRDSRINDII